MKKTIASIIIAMGLCIGILASDPPQSKWSLAASSRVLVIVPGLGVNIQFTPIKNIRIDSSIHFYYAYLFDYVGLSYFESDIIYTCLELNLLYVFPGRICNILIGPGVSLYYPDADEVNPCLQIKMEFEFTPRKKSGFFLGITPEISMSRDAHFGWHRFSAFHLGYRWRL